MGRPSHGRLGLRSRGACLRSVRWLGVALVLGAAACAPTPGTIGAVLGQQSDGRVFLRDVPPDLAAAQAGLKEGDELLLIEGQDVRQMSSDQIHYALEGEVGQPVRLTAVRRERIVRVTVTRSAAQKRGKSAPEDVPEPSQETQE